MSENEHIDEQTLWNYATGVLVGAEATNAELHIQACQQCSAMLDGLPLHEDPLIRKLRQVHANRPAKVQNDAALPRKSILLEVFEDGTLVFHCELTKTVEIGRQKESDPISLGLIQAEGGDRLVIAPLRFLSMSRSHLRLTPQPSALITVTNLASKGAVFMADKIRLNPGESKDVSLPSKISLGKHRLRLRFVPSNDSRLIPPNSLIG